MRAALFLLFITTRLLAADCAPMNLITEKDSPFDQIPVADQNGAYICYAIAVAQAVNYNQVKNGLAPEVHPLWVALKSAEARNKPSLNGGEVRASLEALSKLGNCPADVISKQLEKFTKNAYVTESEFISLIEIIASNGKKIISGHGSSARASASLSLAERKAAFETAKVEQEPRCSDIPSWKQFSSLQSLEILSSPKFFENLVFPGCSNNPSMIKPFSHQVTGVFEDNEFTPKLDKKLDESKSPAILSFCGSSIRKKNYRGVTPDRRSHSDDCDPHSALIVGKKKIGNSCHFLLRNSYGNGFNKNYQSYKCVCRDKKTGAFLDDCSRESHNNGKYSVEGCWIPEDILSKNTFYFTNLK